MSKNKHRNNNYNRNIQNKVNNSVTSNNSGTNANTALNTINGEGNKMAESTYVNKVANISEMVRSNAIRGGVETVADKALSAMLGNVMGTVTEEVVEDVVETNVTNCLPEDFSTPVQTEHVPVEKAPVETSMLQQQLANIGLLNTVELLAKADGLSPVAVEQAAIAIHMLVHSLTKDQATVVNRFYNEGIDIMQYVTNKFNAAQMFYIGNELRAGHDVMAISRTAEYTVSQMIEIQMSVTKDLPTDYITSAMMPSVMGALRRAVESGIDISEITPRASELTAVQVSMLAELKYFGCDVKSIIGDSGQLTEEALTASVREYYTKRDNMKFELSVEAGTLVQV